MAQPAPEYSTYLEDGGCSFNNNTSERSCKAFVTGRKNWLFSDTPEGANASALVYSIVETAKANDIDVYFYLKYLLIKTPTTLTSDDELEKLCPWNPDCRDAVDALYRENQKSVFDAMWSKPYVNCQGASVLCGLRFIYGQLSPCT